MGEGPGEDVGAVVEAGVEVEEVKGAQGGDEDGDGDEAPGGSGEEAAEGVGGAEAVVADAAVF